MSDERKADGKAFPVGAVLSAYTGILLCDFGVMHEYIQHVFGRPVWTHEMGERDFLSQLQERIKESGDFERATASLVGINTLCVASPRSRKEVQNG